MVKFKILRINNDDMKSSVLFKKNYNVYGTPPPTQTNDLSSLDGFNVIE